MIATIYHNPRCGTSRKTLALLEEAGATVTVIEYLKRPPTVADLSRLYARAGLTPRDGLRLSEPDGKRLADSEADDAAILEAMAINPIIIQRPLVETDKGVVLARPPEAVRTIL
ncbi:MULTISPECIES: arsenate reductase family protein [Sphingomonas]|uniref:Arsenate reductase n=1 Tax=Sphingomonas kyungheensis TaxID=1069987 RepID=A0ABU8H125_9SPHN|nr:arsenate reductase family protein [Sphingomonas sp. RIT328]EZP57349.1 Arsenate reductase [Sphingomonas sp. RIT328]